MKAMVARIAMITMTTMSSVNVNPLGEFLALAQIMGFGAGLEGWMGCLENQSRVSLKSSNIEAAEDHADIPNLLLGGMGMPKSKLCASK